MMMVTETCFKTLAVLKTVLSICKKEVDTPARRTFETSRSFYHTIQLQLVNKYTQRRITCLKVEVPKDQKVVRGSGIEINQCTYLLNKIFFILRWRPV